MAQAPAQNAQPRMEELVPNLNNYIRGRLAKSEVRSLWVLNLLAVGKAPSSQMAD
jgi:hypothetical protein